MLGRFAHAAHAIWATAAVYLLVCGLLVAQRYQFALTEDAFRQQQQLASQNVLVSVFEANKAAIVIPRRAWALGRIIPLGVFSGRHDADHPPG